ncbi:nicotinate-nucleotide--dimethylbenzimidazole phosphoribosyltransferase [Anaerosinus massiliensis]|uniref:nicotinate-nucleotide--dimethylbenzimidazole phosphoribosyltransferase n=1 Tax=Massilibacillus massiliensis TaxID=1806837 RepID=UPI000AEE58F8|nr:nicotinate-nucleotide--dimethylbenzimidazole phosphoribosyltransferase [Massilibacillus massiliensis]
MDFSQQVNAVIDHMAKPHNSLGLLEKYMKKVFLGWGVFYQEVRPFHLIFAADNGVTEEAVVKQSPEITYLQAKNMIDGCATISCFCKSNQIPYKVIDVGVNQLEAVGVNYKARMGTKNFLKTEAMDRQEFLKAFQAGEDMVKQAAEEGYNLISFGEMGIGNTTTSSAVLHALTDIQPEFIVGYGANQQNPEVIKRKREVVRVGVELHRFKMQTVEDILRCVGGFDLVAIYAGMLACAKQKVPFVIDGFITAVAYACAVNMDKSVQAYAIPSHISREPGMEYALSLGNIEYKDVPIRADMALGEGTGAVFMVVMLRTMLHAVWHVSKLSEFDHKIIGNKLEAL